MKENFSLDFVCLFVCFYCCLNIRKGNFKLGIMSPGIICKILKTEEKEFCHTCNCFLEDCIQTWE